MLAKSVNLSEVTGVETANKRFCRDYALDLSPNAQNGLSILDGGHSVRWTLVAELVPPFGCSLMSWVEALE